MEKKKYAPTALTMLCFFVSCNLFALPTYHYSTCEQNNHHLSDSLYRVTVKLNQNVEYAKTHHNPDLLANTYNALGNVFSKMGAYDIAKKNYIKAYTLFDSLKKPEKVDMVLTCLAKSNLEDKNYKTFDSIIPIALAHSKKLNSINTVANLSFLTIKNYYVFNNKNTIKYANEGLEAIKQFHHAQKDTLNNLTIKHFEESFKYYKAVALIKQKKHTEGYQLLFQINEDSLYDKQDVKDIPYTKLASLNYYKHLYYATIEKNQNLALKHLLKSDSYKLKAFKLLENQNIVNGDLITKIFETEKQLKLTEALRKKDLKINNTFAVATVFLFLLILVLTGFLFYFYNNRKRIKTINHKLKKANKKLIEADKERMEFFSILSHELRTPVYGISGLANLLQEETSNEKKAYYLEALHASSNYIAVLIDNVLQASKFKFEIKALKPTPNNLFEIVADITDNIKVSAKNKGLKFITEVNISKNDTLLIDKIAFSQVLINLVYNAIRYTPEGYVALYITETHHTNTDASFYFEIKDTGKGIEEKYRNVIFKAFENNAFLSKNSEGSGLGLFVVKTLLNLHGSEIDFTSKPNVGTTFFFTITFKIEPKKQCNTPILLQKNDKEYRILIVDDNKINLLVTKKNIEKVPNCKSTTCENGPDAIALAKQEHFDLILMDLNMPGMDGFQAAKQIRLFNPTIPIIALTALNSTETTKKVKDSNMDCVITKPYNFTEFQETITRLLTTSCQV
ncbi:MAG: response regulator [Flavobacteriaceae bacterium]